MNTSQLQEVVQLIQTIKDQQQRNRELLLQFITKQQQEMVQLRSVVEGFDRRIKYLEAWDRYRYHISVSEKMSMSFNEYARKYYGL